MNDETAFLIRLYCDQPLAVDQLPYTSEIKNIMIMYRARTHEQVDESWIYRRLIKLRKGRLLPTKGRKKSLKKENLDA